MAELVHEVLAAIGRGDVERLLDLTDPEVAWQSFFAELHGREYRGHAGLHRYMRDLEDAFEDIRPVARDLLCVGPLVIAVGSIHYRGRTSGVETESAAGWVFRFGDRKVLRFRAFRDPVETFEAIGR
jgi:ketosteroid isomerase-like protein